VTDRRFPPPSRVTDATGHTLHMQIRVEARLRWRGWEKRAFWSLSDPKPTSSNNQFFAARQPTQE
jgi:hypothetical protein